MENIKKIADELRAQIQDEWTMGSPRTSRTTYKELQPYDPQSLAGSYVATYADYIYSRNSLFWRTINTKIATMLGYYNEANDYLKRDSYRVPTRHVAQCLRHTSLAYIMNLIYCGLLQNSITPKHIQQVQGIPSDEKGLGLQIAGIDVEEYNELLKSTTPTHTSTGQDTDNKTYIPEDDRSRLIWKVAQDAGYIDANRQWIDKGHTKRQRAIVAHELGTYLGVNYDSYFQNLWNCRSMSSEYFNALQKDKDKISQMFKDALRKAGYFAS